MYLIVVGGILLLLFGVGLGAVSAATIVKIIQSGSADGLDSALAVVMAIFIVAAFGMIILGRKLIRKGREMERGLEREEISDYQPMMEKQDNKKWLWVRNPKVWNIGLLFVAVMCIILSPAFEAFSPVWLAFMLVGFVCTMVFGIRYAIEKDSFWDAPRARMARIGVPVFIYLGIVYFIATYM